MENQTIRMRVRPIAEGIYGAIALNYPKAKEHRMIFSDAADGALRIEGGNPDRYFAPADPLWWLHFMYADAPASIEIEGTLKKRNDDRR